MKKYLSINYNILIIIGFIGVVVTLGFDFFRPGKPNFGDKQFIGFVGSIFILLAGLGLSSRAKKNFWDFVSLLIYIAGLFYLVLMPHHYDHYDHYDHFYHHSHSGLLSLTGFNAYDFILNVFGFMPLGYLLMSLFTKSAGKYRRSRTFLMIFLIGVLLSFLIEIGQYFIPGRTSSLIDVVANGSGNFFGMLLFLLISSFTEKR